MSLQISNNERPGPGNDCGQTPAQFSKGSPVCSSGRTASIQPQSQRKPESVSQDTTILRKFRYTDFKIVIFSGNTEIFGISVSWSVMIVISNLVMSIVEREPSSFRIIVEQPITTAAADRVNLVNHL